MVLHLCGRIIGCIVFLVCLQVDEPITMGGRGGVVFTILHV